MKGWEKYAKRIGSGYLNLFKTIWRWLNKLYQKKQTPEYKENQLKTIKLDIELINAKKKLQQARTGSCNGGYTIPSQEEINKSHKEIFGY